VHPAEVLFPDGRFVKDARAFVTSHRLIVWQRDGPSKMHEMLLAEPFSVEARRGTLGGSLEVETSEGTVHLSRGYGCGCGSPLLALAPPVGWTG
jgi:hypothetical protein